jgi:hypothetical protein
MVIPRYDVIRNDFIKYRNEQMSSSVAIGLLAFQWELSEKRILEIIGEE